MDHPATGLKPIGFSDDDPAKAHEDYRGLPVLGTTAVVKELLTRHQIDTVFLALPVEAHKTMLRILKEVGAEMIDLRVVPDLFQYVTFKAGIEDFDGLPVINLTQVPLEGWNSMVKRTMDVVLSSVGLVALAMIYPFVALAILLEDRGPAAVHRENPARVLPRADGAPFPRPSAMGSVGQGLLFVLSWVRAHVRSSPRQNGCLDLEPAL